MELSKNNGIVLHKHNNVIRSKKITATPQYPVHVQISPIASKISFFALLSNQNPINFHALHLLVKTL